MSEFKVCLIRSASLSLTWQNFAPKVLVIEEAGQVLEAHVLATLFPTVQHVIAIGDPLQLRPNINRYGMRLPCQNENRLIMIDFSAEHRTGGQLYNFDISLMERLARQGFPMSQLQIQRRMRPEVSSLIRCVSCCETALDRTLTAHRNGFYPKLQDHPLVTTDRPPVSGMMKSV